jgi:thymidylate synthase
MNTLTCRNVNDGFESALHLMKVAGVRQNSRNGPVLTLPGPVIVEFRHPKERVHLCPVRDANPYFHVMEAMWMLAGRKDVHWPSLFASNIRKYSDDGVDLSGAYGYRWRFQFGVDQIAKVVNHLNLDRDTRRATIAMWDPSQDARLLNDGLDVPCNTHLYFRPEGDRLHMTVCNRSNDLVWGLFGANVVHMSFLHELVAAATNFEVGSYYQMTNNLHVYEQHWSLVESPPVAVPYPDIDGVEFFDQSLNRFYTDLSVFMNYSSSPQEFYHSQEWFKRVLYPMKVSWGAYKDKDRSKAEDFANQICDSLWRRACLEWLGRRKWSKDE